MMSVVDQDQCIFTACGLDLDFIDVEVITLKQHFRDVIYSKAVDRLTTDFNPNLSDPALFEKKITRLMKKLIDEQSTEVNEFITLTSSKITICVDVEEITFDNCYEICMNHLPSIQCMIEGQTLALSNPITLSLEDLNTRRPQKTFKTTLQAIS